MVLRRTTTRGGDSIWEGAQGDELSGLNQRALITHGLLDSNAYDNTVDFGYRMGERTRYTSFDDYMLNDSRSDTLFEHSETQYPAASSGQSNGIGSTGATSTSADAAVHAGGAVMCMGMSMGGPGGYSGVQARVQAQVPHRSVVPAHASSYQTSQTFTSTSSDQYALPFSNHRLPVSALSSQQSYNTIALAYTQGFTGHAISPQTAPPTFPETTATTTFVMSNNSSEGSLSDDSPNSSPSVPTRRPSYSVVNAGNFRPSNENGTGLSIAPFPDAARLMPSAAMSMSPTLAPAYGTIGNPKASFYRANSTSTDGKYLPFDTFQTMHDIYSEHQRVMPVIEAATVRNVFWLNPHWTCYRRNYISVSCSYTLANALPGKPLFLETGSPDSPKREQIQALALRLTAVVDKAQGKEILLVQYTPKRDKGNRQNVRWERAYPKARLNMAGLGALSEFPTLPLQAEDEEKSPSGSSAPSRHTSITFDRIQFETATANNGRRRAEQQFYHLVVGLYADMRESPESAVKWTKIAHQVSDRIIVRGRSPRHYKKGDEATTGPSRGPDGGPGGGAGGPSRSNGSPPRRLGAQRGVGSSSATASYARGGGYTQAGNSYQMTQHQQYSSPSTMTSYAATTMSPTVSHSLGQTSNVFSNDGLEAQYYREYQDKAAYMYFPGHLSDHFHASYNPHTMANSDQQQGQRTSHAGLSLKLEESENASGQRPRHSNDREGNNARELYTPRSMTSGEGFMYPTISQAILPWQPDSCGRFQATDTTRGWYPGLTSTGY